MKVSVLLQKIREYIIPKDAEIQVAAFNILALCGVIVSVITAIVNAASGHWPVVGADLSGVICSLALMIYCHRTGNYRRAMILTVFIVFLGLFTALYFIQGGYHSGIPAFFIFGVVFTAFLLNGATMVIVSVSLATTMYCQIRVYRKKQQELNEAILAMNELIVSNTSSTKIREWVNDSNITGKRKRPLVIIAGVIGTVASFFIYDHFIKWLTILNCILPPIGAVIIVDYFVNRGRYEEDEKSLPSVNTGNVISVLAGAFTGIVFNKGISGVNAMLVSIIVYLLIRRFSDSTGGRIHKSTTGSC